MVGVMPKKKKNTNFDVNKISNTVIDLVKGLVEYFKVPIHKEGYPFIVGFFAAGLLFGLVLEKVGMLFIFLGFFSIFFFRNPKRFTPVGKGLVVSPADGTVHKIESGVSAPDELSMGNKKFTRVSIFLSVLNVHVNRVPVGGTIKKVHYREGKFLNATLDKASKDNERNCCVVETESGKDVVFVQIAGLIARRIVCNAEEGQKFKTGEEYGIIRFGSRLDVYLPTGVKPEVLVGQTMIGGETIIAKI